MVFSLADLRTPRGRRRIVGDLAQTYLNALLPLWRLDARRVRARRCNCLVVVTGSCGKSTATMIAGILLAAQRPAERGMYLNTERHVLRAVRRLRRPVDYFIQEASEYPVGTLAAVGRTLPPDIAVVTSVGLDHFDAFETREAVAAEMRPFVEAVPPAGLVCLNADDDLARGLAGVARGRVLLFGCAADADIRAESVVAELPGRLRFDLVVGDVRRPVATRFLGTLMLPSILAALAVIHAASLDLDQAIARLARIEPLAGRMRTVEIPGGHTYLLDTWKAPLWSTQKLVDDLPTMSAGRRIFVLGDMSDIGNSPGNKYRRVLRHAVANADLVVGIASASGPARRLGQADGSLAVRSIGNIEELGDLLAAEPPSLVVLKGNKLPWEQLPGLEEHSRV